MNNENNEATLDKLQYVIDVRTKEIENIKSILKKGNGDKDFLTGRIKLLKRQISDTNNIICTYLDETNS